MGLNASAAVMHPAFQAPFTIRRSTVAMQEGEAVVTGVTDTVVSGVVQPAKPADLMTLPEGQRTGEIKVFWSTVEMKATPGAPDILIDENGRAFRVVKLEGRTGYWKALAEFFTP